MRRYALVVVALALSACATTAQGATETPDPGSSGGPTGSPDAAPASSSASPGPTTAATAAPSAPSGPSPIASASPSSIPSPSPSASPSASPSSSPSPTVTPAPVDAFVLGDSISLSIAGRLAAFGYPVAGRVGQSASSAFLQEQLSGPQAQAAPAWVIILGTNNRGDDADVSRLSDWIDTVDSLRTRGAKQRVYWVTPHRPDSYVGGMARWSLDGFNAELMRLADDRRWLRIIDFASWAKAHPEWFEADGAHLHPDARGQAALLALIAGTDPKLADTPAVVDTLESLGPTIEPQPEDPVFDNSTG